MATPTKKTSRMSLSTQVLWGLALGLVVGIFLGELAAPLKVVGRAFLLLLQMTVLPYVIVSLIAGFGRMTYHEITNIALKVGFLLVISWLLVFAVIVAMPLAFPTWESASFFSTTLIEESEPINFLALYIPSNPFYSMANNIVPAVVVFSVAMGIAIIGLDNKQALLDPLGVLNKGLMRIMQTVSKLMPLGVFAIIASTAGTLSLEDLSRLQVYLVTYAAMALLLTFGILPAMVTSLTSLTYRQVVGHTRDVLLTAFATGSGLIVLPLMVERSRELLQQAALNTPETESAVEVIIPAFFNFPKVGTLLPMSFVLFAGWFAGVTVSLTQYPVFLLSGLVSLFGSPNVAIPFLMDMLRIPVDLFEFFIATNVVTGRFARMLSTMHNIVLALLGACAIAGLLTIRWGRVLRNAVLMAGLAVVMIGAAHVFFTNVLENAYDKDKIIAGMQLLRSPGPATVYTSPPPPLPPPEGSAQSHLERIRARGIIRVGYRPDLLPFSYFNAAGDLVGFDIEMAHTLARDLGVALEFVPVDTDTMAKQLNTGYCDIVMTGVAITPERMLETAFSAPYMNQTIAFIVKDHRRDEFNSRKAVKRLKAPRLGVPNVPYYVNKVRRYLPQAEIVILHSLEEFFDSRGDELDALVFSAEAGSAWTLLHPSYTVTIPHPDVLAAPVAYPMARGDRDMRDFINNWLILKQKDKTIEALYDYWVLGKNAMPTPPRWSVIRNVLHWVQ